MTILEISVSMYSPYCRNYNDTKRIESVQKLEVAHYRSAFLNIPGVDYTLSYTATHNPHRRRHLQ